MKLFKQETIGFNRKTMVNSLNDLRNYYKYFLVLSIK